MFTIEVCEAWLEGTSEPMPNSKIIDMLKTPNRALALQWATSEATELPDHIVRVIEGPSGVYVYIHVPFIPCCPICLGTDALGSGQHGVGGQPGQVFCSRCGKWFDKQDLTGPTHKQGGY